MRGRQPVLRLDKAFPLKHSSRLLPSWHDDPALLKPESQGKPGCCGCPSFKKIFLCTTATAVLVLVACFFAWSSQRLHYDTWPAAGQTPVRGHTAGAPSTSSNTNSAGRHSGTGSAASAGSPSAGSSGDSQGGSSSGGSKVGSGSSSAAGGPYNDTHRPPFAWASPDWDEQYARLLLALEPGDYQGLHNVSRRRLGRDDEAAAQGGNPGSSDQGAAQTLAYHLVLTSCYRAHWGRYLSTTLLNVWLQGAAPTTLTVLWCQPYNASATMPSLFFNLRHSTNIRLLHVPTPDSGLPIHPVSTYFWALTVPDYLQRPELPLLVMEDDAVMAPQFGRKLWTAVYWVKQAKAEGDYMLNLYNPSAAVDSAIKMLDGVRYNDSTRQTFRRSAAATTRATGALHGTLRRGEKAWGYGVQGQLYSPGMRADLARHFWEVQTGRVSAPGFQDMVLNDYFYKRRVNQSDCVFGVQPSMLEHTGASSGVFGGVSRRFHMSDDYPYHVLVPFFDNDTAW